MNDDDGPIVTGRDEDARDVIEASAARDEVRDHGTIAWDMVKAELRGAAPAGSGPTGRRLY